MIDYTKLEKRLAEEGYEAVGWGTPKRGESFLSFSGIVLEEGSPLANYNRLILRKKRPTTFEFDGQTFPLPEGYVFERVGCPKKEDIGKYILGQTAGSSICDGCRLTPGNLSLFANIIYFIFRKEN